ncbi:BQ2448_5518 [Microbotryum intermedium]|uniref:BQ2448_5518 protein n=1 Tax=Microbotryum intermedium TaxID=269621 RepID=A0A238F4B7_9BASI|nr:BQ2448_5518 [Microbotryum intermedium]
MDGTIDQLARLVLERVPLDHRLLIAIAGVPGSGKSTLAYPLVDAINAKLSSTSSTTASSTPKTAGILRARTNIDQETELLDFRAQANDDKITEGSAAESGEAHHDQIAIAVGLDGWHYSRAELDKFPDPNEARTRRGAAFTFDAPSYLAFIVALRESIPSTTSTTTTPSSFTIPYHTFSHSLKDPLPSLHPITPQNRIIVIEGLYTLVKEGVWASATTRMDLRIWLECDPKVVRERLLRRCLKEGIEDTVEKAQQRVDGSDMLNGEWISTRLTRDQDLIVIESKEDVRLVTLGP